ncbi:MAG: alpha-glucosidase C-terminal domain-containing protein, partial [Rhizobiaceae bacterium]
AQTGDRRNSGSFASLAGLEAALETGSQSLIEFAVNRVLMGHALMASFGGVPLFYMGDELGLTNDYGFTDEPEHAHDNRWMHRPEMDWAIVKGIAKAQSAHGSIWRGTRHIIENRKTVPAFAATNPVDILQFGNPAVFAFARRGEAQTVVCLFNFTEINQSVSAEAISRAGAVRFHDLLDDAPVDTSTGQVLLAPYSAKWIA